MVRFGRSTSDSFNKLVCSTMNQIGTLTNKARIGISNFVWNVLNKWLKYLHIIYKLNLLWKCWINETSLSPILFPLVLT